MTRWSVAAAVATWVMAGLPVAARAQDGKGFLFRPPTAAVTLRGGVADATGRSDLFDYTTQMLSLNRSDFRGATFGADVAIGTARPWLDVVFGAGYASAKPASDFRDWNDNQDRPITQTTSLKRVPLTLGLKAYVTPRGQEIGSLAWVPARVAPFVSAGVGATWYRFRQVGSFIDLNTDPPPVFDDSFQSSGWGPSAYAGAGFDFSIGPRMALTADARYMYAQAGVGGDYSGFDRIDLSGLATTIGITFRY